MKYKKYVLFMLLILVTSVNIVHADNMCYYISNGFSARYNTSTHDVYVDKASSEIDSDGDKEDILNLNKEKEIDNWTIPAYSTPNKCPTYLILSYDRCQFLCIFEEYEIYATDNESDAIKAIEDIGHETKQYGFYSKVKSNMSEEEYREKRFENVFAPHEGYGGTDVNVDCESLFGNKDDEKSIAYLVNEILGYVRIAVPILLIVLGIIDFARATVASKEDEMKKAQKDFIIRAIAAIAVFFAPQIVAILMHLADIVWEGLGYSTCGIN